MDITIKEIESSIKNIFSDSDVLNTESVYEKIDDSDNLKLVLFINKLFVGDVSILYTKLIFVVNSTKTKLINNSFLYLYDINCKYTNVDFSDTEDFEKRLKKIIDKKIFGNDLKILSEFIESPAIIIDEWLKKNHIKDINVSTVKYNPDMYIMPCKSLSFSFDIIVNNISVYFNISKEKNNIYNFNFKINDDVTNIEKPNLKTLIETIGTILKNNLKQ